MSFGERLAFLRDGKLLTQNELAQLTKISRSRLSLYEINKREPDLETIKQLADFFEVTTDYLLCRTDEPRGTKQVQTIAAHRTDDPMSDLPPEAIERVEEFKELMRLKYGKKST